MKISTRKFLINIIIKNHETTNWLCAILCTKINDLKMKRQLKRHGSDGNKISPRPINRRTIPKIRQTTC